MIKVLISDDHPMVRQGLKLILSTCIDIVVTGEAVNCQQTLDKVTAESFDIVLLDLKMPDGLGLDIIEDIITAKPGLPVLMLSAYQEEPYAITALKAGASGYLVKGSLPRELAYAIREVTAGRKYISSCLAERMAACKNDHVDMNHENFSRCEGNPPIFNRS